VQIRGAKHTKGREGQLKAKSVDLIKLQIDKGQLNTLLKFLLLGRKECEVE
jgi:hypothetical protein